MTTVRDIGVVVNSPWTMPHDPLGQRSPKVFGLHVELGEVNWHLDRWHVVDGPTTSTLKFGGASQDYGGI